MLQIQYIKEHREEVINLLAIKNFNASDHIQQVIDLDTKRRNSQKKLDDLLAESNKSAKEIGMLYKTGKVEEANKLKEVTIGYKHEAKVLSDRLGEVSEQLKALLLEIPNIPHPSVPGGKTEQDNVLVCEEGSFPELDEKALPHWDLIKKYDIIDFELGNKVTGAGFPFYKGKGARLQRGLINYFLDKALEAGYVEYQTPLLVNRDSGYGTGQLPDKDGQMYRINEEDYYLIPTAEVPITNIYRNSILKAADFPIKNVAYSNCFRREAGSWGKDVRGLNRLHQFDKVEIVQIQHPEKSYETLEEMKDHVACLLRELNLPFRIMRLCGGDLSFTSALTYDFEVFSGAQKKWLEVSSVSNFESFQANRLKLRFKDTDGKTKLTHTLNGSALALPRIVAALLENNQTEEGIRVPGVLVPYTGFEVIG